MWCKLTPKNKTPPAIAVAIFTSRPHTVKTVGYTTEPECARPGRSNVKMDTSLGIPGGVNPFGPCCTRDGRIPLSPIPKDPNEEAAAAAHLPEPDLPGVLVIGDAAQTVEANGRNVTQKFGGDHFFFLKGNQPLALVKARHLTVRACLPTTSQRADMGADARLLSVPPKAALSSQNLRRGDPFPIFKPHPIQRAAA